MALRNFKFDVMVNGIIPNIVNDAGVQGDHGVTRLDFELAEEIYKEITGSVADGKVMYRFDIYDGEGGVWQSEPLMLLARDVGITLEERHTRFGGKVMVYLVITSLSSQNGTEIEQYNAPVILQFKNRPNGVYKKGENYESVVSLVEKAAQQVLLAKNFADESKNYSVQIRDFISEIEEKIENGDYTGVGISNISIINDELIITYSDGVSHNLGNIKGPPGEKGDMVLIDQTYDPKSDNPQSGTAVAKALEEYYTKDEVDALDHASKAYVAEEITKVNLDGSVDLSNYYTKSETDATFAEFDSRINEANDYGIRVEQKLGNYYTKSEVDNKIASGSSVDLSNYYTKGEVDEKSNTKIDVTFTPINIYLQTAQETADGTYIGVLTNITKESIMWTFKITTAETSVVVIKTDIANEYSQEYFESLGFVIGNTYQVVINEGSVSSFSRHTTLDDYYTKTEIDSKIGSGDGTVDLGEYYTKGEVDDAFDGVIHRVEGDTHHPLIYARQRDNANTSPDTTYKADNIYYLTAWGFEPQTIGGVEVKPYGDIPLRQGSNGNIYTGTPERDNDAANKKYVDDLVGGIESLLGGI